MRGTLAHTQTTLANIWVQRLKCYERSSSTTDTNVAANIKNTSKRWLIYLPSFALRTGRVKWRAYKTNGRAVLAENSCLRAKNISTPNVQQHWLLDFVWSTGKRLFFNCPLNFIIIWWASPHTVAILQIKLIEWHHRFSTFTRSRHFYKTKSMTVTSRKMPTFAKETNLSDSGTLYQCGHKIDFLSFFKWIFCSGEIWWLHTEKSKNSTLKIGSQREKSTVLTLKKAYTENWSQVFAESMNVIDL